MHSATAGSTDAESGAPVWVLLGHKAGDNHQVLALAESLGVPFERRELRYRPTELASNILLGPNLAGLEAGSRSRLTPPWPWKLVAAVVRRMSVKKSRPSPYRPATPSHAKPCKDYVPR